MPVHCHEGGAWERLPVPSADWRQKAQLSSSLLAGNSHAPGTVSSKWAQPGGPHELGQHMTSQHSLRGNPVFQGPCDVFLQSRGSLVQAARSGVFPCVEAQDARMSAISRARASLNTWAAQSLSLLRRAASPWTSVRPRPHLQGHPPV